MKLQESLRVSLPRSIRGSQGHSSVREFDLKWVRLSSRDGYVSRSPCSGSRADVGAY